MHLSKPLSLLGAALLSATAIATVAWAETEMVWLIHLVGEERALGAGNVIRRPDGAVLLTNPTAMVQVGVAALPARAGWRASRPTRLDIESSSTDSR